MLIIFAKLPFADYRNFMNILLIEYEIVTIQNESR